MDEQTRTDVIDALRDAAKALRLAEKALVTSPVVPVAAPSLTAPSVEPVVVSNPTEEALFQYVLSEAQTRKTFEESNSTSFGVLVADQGDELLKFAVDRRLYKVGPGASGTVRPEPTASRSVFERLLKTMTSCRLEANEALAAFTSKPDLKNWSDVNPEKDLVLMQYETPGPVEHQLDAAKLQVLVESARLAPGSVERAASRLKENHVRWDPIVRDAVNPSIQIENVEARWSAVVDLTRIAQSLTEKLAAIDVDPAKSQSPWWPAAQADAMVPAEALPVVRGGERYLLLQSEAANEIENWASKLPGWFEDQPLIIRDVSTEEVLSQNSGDGMSNNVKSSKSIDAKLAELSKLLADVMEDDEAPAEDAPACPACGGDGTKLGALGAREHFRCRDCGIDFSESGKAEARTVKAEAPPMEQKPPKEKKFCPECAGKLARIGGKLVCQSCGYDWSGEKTVEESQMAFASTKKPERPAKKSPVKAAPYEQATPYEPENKTYLRKVNRIIKMGLLSSDEITGAVVEALRLAKVSPRLAGAVAHKVKDALFEAQSDVVDVTARTKKR